MSKIYSGKIKAFAYVMGGIRTDFPELAKENDRAVFDAFQYLTACESCEPDCECRMTFEQSHNSLPKLASEKIPLEKMCAFVQEMKRVRLMFPELAKEIDRCLFNAGQNNLGSCGHGDCDCQMTFEQFHAAQNRAFHTTSERQGYEFN